jgi:hypothetical protein
MADIIRPNSLDGIVGAVAPPQIFLLTFTASKRKLIPFSGIKELQRRTAIGFEAKPIYGYQPRV